MTTPPFPLQQLQASNLPVLLPNTTAYTAHQSSYWSRTARQPQPAAIVLPRTAADVSAALQALVAAQTPFAIRSGGHMQWRGANNIGQQGVTLDLSALDATRYDAQHETVEVGAGARWRDVYSALEGVGRVVAGGREGNVGVGGFLLGGGLTFFTARQGFGCDNVVAYEVVLADGRIVTATQDNPHSDLFVALKGGANNFGIVTRFTLKAIACTRIWSGLLIFPQSTTTAALAAVTAFTRDLHAHPDDNLMCILTYLPRFKQVMVVAICANMAGVERAPAYASFLALPDVVADTTKTTTVREMAVEYNAEDGNHVVMFTLTVKNEERILAKAAALHQELVAQLRDMPMMGGGDDEFTTQCAFHPLPRVFGDKSVEAGGNVMGIERHSHDGVVFAAAVFVKTDEQEAAVYPLVAAWVQGVSDYAQSVNGLLPWRYVNYADGSQDPLASYGPEGVDKMRAAAAKYDPDRVFQRLCPGGFKISRTQV